MNALLLLTFALSAAGHDDTVGARDCLALVVFSEARGESYLGQAAVAQVVINRARAFDLDVCGAATAPGAFHGVERWPYPREPWKVDSDAWEQAREVADAVLVGDFVVSPPSCASALYFYARGTDPGSLSRFPVVCEVGEHVFLGAP